MKNNWKFSENQINIDNLETLAEVDVLVVGAGPAGVAAATVCAENGLSTVVIEKYGFCGGSAVAGMSATVCGMYLTCEDNSGKTPPNQIVHGFAERFRAKMEKNGGLYDPQVYGNTYVIPHEARIWKNTADEFLTEAGVKVLYHTTAIQAIKDGEILTGVVVFSGLGMGKIMAKRIIDSSGDGIVATMAGADFTCGHDGNVQNPTIIFKLSGVDREKFWNYYGTDTICHDEFSEKLYAYEKEKNVSLPRKKIWVFQTIHDDELFINGTAVNHQSEKLNMIDPEHFTYSEIEARKQLMSYANFFKDCIPGCENSYVGETACEVGVRQTRSIKCKYTLTNEDVEMCRKFPDGIVKSSWPIELHKGEFPKLHWLTNDYYEVPFDTLKPTGLDNILVAGRCLSAEHEALASARVTAQCFEYGHAAAVATVLSLKEGIKTSEVDGVKVREIMKV